MEKNKNIMSYESVLPEDFDGTFKFSNPSDEDFIGEWNKKEYRFPAQSTVPVIMVEHSPLEIQHIRKHFAKKLAEREFYKSKSYKTMQGQEGTPGNRTMSSIHQAITYTLNDLAPYIQLCLKPLPEAKLTGKPVVKPTVVEKLSRDDDGNLNTEAIDSKTSLKQKALNT